MLTITLSENLTDGVVSKHENGLYIYSSIGSAASRDWLARRHGLSKAEAGAPGAFVKSV